ncbi:Coiled-coil domain-containing protein 18, putative isoform 2 [Melia azedarach]|uniref:Coiled-coil domain-containing protein 18, putative isoform 2 n=1 Tax=Melia azedarach TaxID=155640 RepID=A0ACC1WPT8_MELAZ|nr:Coiled-coil domain-containing protein 18, putative isoform 2 [Melia azedarach]
MDQNSSESSKLQRKSSIETEPKTLFEEEMNSAREAALRVINSKTREEALKIFLEGLKLVGAAVDQNWQLNSDSDEE